MTDSNLLARVEKLEAELQHHRDLEAIRDLMYEYGFSFDEDRFEDFVQCFTPDAEGTYSPFAQGFRGHQEIREFCERLRGEDASPRLEMVIHYTVSPIIEIDGDSATGRWNWMVPCTVKKTDGERVAAWQFGRYDLKYARTDAGWKISHQHCTYFHVFELDKGWVKQPMLTMTADA